jgi:tubulin delta
MANDLNAFFRPHPHVPAQWIARAVAVDAEIKVLQSLPVVSIHRDFNNHAADGPESSIKSSSSGSWAYDHRNVIYDKTGSANNWAYGYHRHGPRLFERMRDRIRREVALCDGFSGFVVLQSLAGGTGSGVGSSCP